MTCRHQSLSRCIVGDFNEVLYVEERHRVRRTSGMDNFSSFVDGMSLMYVLITGPCFTWSNLQADSAMSKLDTFLISIDWEDLFSPLMAVALPRLVSDHVPIFLGGGEVSAGPKPFSSSLCG